MVRSLIVFMSVSFTLTDTDQMTIAASNSDGKGYRVLVEKADRVEEPRLLSSDRILVFYYLGKKLFVVEVNPRLAEVKPEYYEIEVSP